ncbi:UNVERIFIED_CONTAM: hypothetical protein FKN15_015537 [Acipenser sinensis]
MGIRKKTNKSPPVFSHEFIIQNHADIVSCVAMVFLLGLMFEVTAKVAVFFVTVQYNVTITTNVIYLHTEKSGERKTEPDANETEVIFDAWKLLQMEKERFLSNPASLWEGYPHTLMLFQMKFFYICQMGYWLHALPELYFQKTKKSVGVQFEQYSSLWQKKHRLIYFSNENNQAGFTVWAILFVLGRLLTLSLSVLTVGFGLGGSEQGLDFASGNFNVLIVRITVLAVICVTQAFMMWKFINFQLRRWREHAQAQSLKKKTVPTKSKSSKKENKGIMQRTAEF